MPQKALKLSRKVDESKPLLRGKLLTEAEHSARQGLTLVHFSAQPKRFLWDMGCIQEAFRICIGAT
jgi:hypothetical protein